MILHDRLPDGVFSYKMQWVRIVALVLAALPLTAGEYAILSSGVTLRENVTRRRIGGGRYLPVPPWSGSPRYRR